MADYAHYGNPLKELEIDEAPKKFKDETVRDEKGRRRFHGAFTGGFSAGYFNSVDTKEGWTPTQFISTRSNRANKSEQKPQDYMDNEDLGELGFAPQRLQLQEGARIIPGKSQSTSSHAGVGSQRELLSAPLKRILKGDRDSVGVMILREMGWRDGKGIGPKVCLRAGYGPQLPPFLADAEVGPDDIELTEIKGTDKVWGLGYTPETRLDLFSEKIDRERLTQTTAKVGGRRLDIRGQAFGVGAFEEDDEDIYAKDDMTQYAFEEVDHSRGDRSRTPKLPMIESGKKQDKGGLLEGFVAVEVHVSSSPASSKPVVVPPDWKPTPLVEQSQKIKAELTREQKVASLFHSLPEGSVFNFLSEDARAKIEATKKALIERKKQSEETSRLTSEPADELSLEAREGSIGEDRANRTYGVVDVTTLRPFAKDPNKQERFDRFVAFAEKGHREMLASIQPPHFSGWEAALEKKEFEAALAIVRPKLGLKNRFEDNQAEDNPHSGLPTGLASASDMPKPSVVPVAEESRGPPIRPLKDFGSRTHARFVWHPASVLCKRFNIPDPYPGQEFVGIPDSSLHLDQPQAEAAEQGSQGQQEGLQDSDLPSTSRTEIPKRSAPAFTAKTRIDDSAVEPEREKTPPAIDIFKMIFSDEEEEESNEQAEVTRENESPDSKTRQTGTAPVVETERKNTGIFANIDLSLLNKRPPPKALASSEARKAAVQEIEQQLVPMGPRPPPILAIETETVQKFMSKKDKKKHKLKDKKRKKDSKSKKKKTKKKKEKHRKRKKGETSSTSSESETSSSEEEHDEKVSRKTEKRKKRKRTREHPKHRSSSSSSEDSDNSSDEERVDKRLKKKLKNLRSPV